MAVYTIQGPDGKVYDVEMPGGNPQTTSSATTENPILHWAKVLGSAALRGAASLPAMAAEAGLAEPRAFGRKSKGTEQHSPMGDVAQLGTQPETKPEKYAASTLEGAVGGAVVPGGGVARSALTGAASGLGSEVFDQLTGGANNPLARIAGALLGGGTVEAARRVPVNATSILKKDLSALSQEDFDKALSLRDYMAGKGMTHSASQLFGDKSTLADTFQRASSNQFVRPRVLGNLASARDDAVNALNVWKAEHLPPTGATPRETLADVQKAAQFAENSLKGDANTAYTAALPNGTSETLIPGTRIKQLVTDLRALAANPSKYGIFSEGGKFISNMADEFEAGLTGGKLLDASGKPVPKSLPLGYLNNALKTLNTRLTSAGIDYKKLPMLDLKELLAASTPEFQAARDAKTAFMRENVNPVQQGLTGQLARMGGGVRPDKYTATESAIPMVINKNRPQPSEIEDLGKAIGTDNVAALLQEHLQRAANSAIQPTTSIGTKLQQPYFIQGAARGEPGSALRTNVDASLRVAANSYKLPASELQGSFHKIMDALESYKDLKIAPSVDATSIDQAAGRNALSAVVAPMSRAGRYIQDAAMAKTYRRIAEIAMSKDGAEQLIAIAKSKDPNTIPAFIQSVLTTSHAGNADRQ